MILNDRSLLNIPIEEWLFLSKRVKEAQGRVIILVHPFYSDRGIPIFQPKEYAEYVKVRNALIKKAKIPIIVLEEESKLKKASDTLSKLGRKDAFLIATGKDDPEILLSSRSKQYSYDLKWLFLKLKQIGVTGLHIGGQYSEYAEDYKRWFMHDKESKMFPFHEIPIDRVIGSGCAGGAYYHALDSKKIDRVRLIPNALYPNKPVRIFKKPK